MKDIPFSKAAFNHQEEKALRRVLKSGWLTMGKETQIFEKEFASYVGADYAVSVNSCTAALFLSLKVLGIGKGDEVIVPSFTFVATVNVICHAGATPVFADIKRDDFTLDPNSVTKHMTRKTKAILPVHYAGVRAHTNYPKTVIEDSAHRIEEKNASANLTCYSFYATKNMTTGEGGMITTSDRKLSEWFIKARLHGMSKDAMKRYQEKNKWEYDVEFPGYKFNTTDLNAAFGKEQLKKLPAFQKKREQKVKRYNSLLHLANKGNHIYPILVNNRSSFISYMAKHNIFCSVHFIPVHRFSYYKHLKPKLPVTEFVGDRVVSLPLFAQLTYEEIERICKLVKAWGYYGQDF